MWMDKHLHQIAGICDIYVGIRRSSSQLLGVGFSICSPLRQLRQGGRPLLQPPKPQKREGKGTTRTPRPGGLCTSVGSACFNTRRRGSKHFSWLVGDMLRFLLLMLLSDSDTSSWFPFQEGAPISHGLQGEPIGQVSASRTSQGMADLPLKGSSSGSHKQRAPHV